MQRQEGLASREGFKLSLRSLGATAVRRHQEAAGDALSYDIIWAPQSGAINCCST